MKSIILMTAVAFLSASISEAQISNAKTETVKVSGNCSMCESAIEKAGNKNKLYKTDWNKDTKMASITYDSKKTDVDAVLKSIALSGYDNVNYLAPQEAYNGLPDCCKYDRDQRALVKNITVLPRSEAMEPVSGHSQHNQENKNDEIQQTNQLKAVFDNYFALKDALVKTDGATASAKASAILAALNAVEMGKLKMEEHDVWMSVEKNLKTDVQQIKENRDVARQREYFISLSQNMYELIKVSKPADTVYYQFCPMANDGKGANWLSKENVIKNPYYGSQMLSCGNTVEIIKQ
ncbi:MAG: DUF3347 domain-containing protein [Chitinophagaceae bacterium]